MFVDKENDNRDYVNLTSTEEAVLAAASRIYAAYITQGKLDEYSESQLMSHSLKQAIALAKKTDNVIRSGNEM